MHKLGDGLLEGAMFGVGVHVGREGNVDLTGRNLDFLGNSLIKMINEDGLGRSAKSLTLTNNALYTIGKEIILLKNLEEIEMNSNRFTHLPEALTLLKKLRRIDVSNNPITPVGFGVLLRLDTLTSLTVKDCQLKQVPDTILSMGPNLVELDLSDNPDIKINESNFGKLKIEVLKIANTGLRGQNLPGGVKVVRTIKSLDISNNAFTFDEDNDNFFGRYMPDTLKELQIRKLGLTSVPQVIARLKLLTSLDLSENPIETLDVLAGRLVKRMSKLSSGGSSTNLEGKGAQVTERNTSSYKDNDPLTANKEDDGLSDDKASNSSRVSISKVSKIGMISSVAQTLPLKKLLLRECGLRTVPKYFHKMTNLEELDLSDNYYLDDPNMTLFSLQKLKKLNITGCPFADNPATARNEWFDIAKLSMLRDLKWERWKVAHNMSPYRTKIPIEICGMQLSSINEVALRKNLFTGNTITTISNLLRDGYFKVDLSVDENVVFSHFEAIKLFKNFKKFFFPDDSTVKHPAPKGTKAEPVVQGNDLGQLHLKIAISRYIFFLAVQAANYDAVIIPPPDVMIIHYAQLTIAPAKYRIDCEAICGRILNCNYRNYFIEEKKNANAAKGTVAASKKIWNLMVRSAQSNLQWLRYDFWDRRTKGTKTTAPQSLLLSLPTDTGGATVDEVLANTNELRQMDSAHDLSNVLDPAISSHFDDQATEVFAESLVSFFRINEHLLQYEGALVNISLDWNRYVQYLALYALRVSAHRVDSMVFEPNYESDLFAPQIPCRVPSLLGPHYDLLNNESFGDPSKYLPQPAHPSCLSLAVTGRRPLHQSGRSLLLKKRSSGGRRWRACR
ncbi:lipoprotein [Angomonas deanei]|nr:lipoprotein [Angomonas deanei]|eukprot:EPY21607.1 lipoprotein [Angomonas deanei]